MGILSSRYLRVGLVALAGSALAVQASAQTTFSEDETNTDISTTTTGAITVASTTTNADIVITVNGTVNGGSAIVMDDATPADNVLTLDADSAGTRDVTIQSTAGAGPTISVTENAVIVLDDTNAVIEKTGGSGAVISSTASTQITNNGVIRLTGGSGDSVISVGATGQLSLTNMGTISTDQDNVTLVNVAAGDASITNFVNYGSIISTGAGGVAVDARGDAGETTLNMMAGSTISGSILLGGTASDTIAINGAGVTFNGNITGDASQGGLVDVNADFTYSSGTITDITAIDVASGSSMTMATGTMIDNSSNNNDLTLTGGGRLDITGVAGNAIDIGTGLFTISNTGTLWTDEDADITGDITIAGTVSGTLSVNGGDIILADGATVGAISGTTGGAAETLTINGAFTNSGAITTIDTITVAGGDFTTSETVTGIGTLNINANRTLTANNTIAGSGDLNMAGTSVLDIAAGASVTIDTLTAAAGAQVNMDIDSTNGSSYLGFTTTTQDASNATLTVNVNAATAEGSYTIVQGVSGGAFGTIEEEFDSVLFTVSGSLSNTSDYIVFVDRTGFDELASNDQNSTLGATLEGLTSSTNTEIQAIMSNLTTAAQSGTTTLNEAMEELNPVVDGLGMASVEIQTEAMNTMSDRMAYLRDGSGVATGDGMYSKHMWLQAFGSTTEQDKRNGIDGFDANAYGIAVGIDSEEIIEDSIVGLSFAYGVADVDSDAANNAQTDINSYQIALYTSRDMADDVYVDGMVSLGMNDYETERTLTGIGKVNGETDGLQASLRGAVGRYIPMGDNFQMIPEASLQYTYLSIDEYTETNGGGANLTVDSDDNSALILGLGGTAAWDFEHASGSVVRAALRGKYTYDMIGDEFETSSTFQAGGAAFTTESAKVAQHGFVLGAGLTLLDASGLEMGVDYDATLKADYVSHAGKLNVRWAF